MIEYQTGGFQFDFVFRSHGSVFPRASMVSIPAGLVSVGLKILQHFEVIEGQELIKNSAAYSGFSFVIGFLLVFRTSQAYSRFWDGATALHQMRSKWCDAVSSLLAFSRVSKNPA